MAKTEPKSETKSTPAPTPGPVYGGAEGERILARLAELAQVERRPHSELDREWARLNNAYARLRQRHEAQQAQAAARAAAAARGEPAADELID